MPSPYSEPTLIAVVRPIVTEPPDSWMWPCRVSSGWTFSIASRTATEPTGAVICAPAAVFTFRSWPSSGAVSCGARIHDQGGDLRPWVTAWSYQPATSYSDVRPPRTSSAGPVLGEVDLRRSAMSV